MNSFFKLDFIGHNKKSNGKWWGEPAFYLITLLTITLVWCVILKVWKADWHIPFDYGTELNNDVLGSSTWIKSYMQNGFSWEQSDFSVPFSTDRNTYFGVDRVVLLMEILCSRLFSSYGACLNTLYLLSFYTTGITAAYSLRCLQFSKGISLAGTIMYTFLQYHMMRGEMHLYLSFYYSAPLAVLLMLWITDESLFAERFSRYRIGRVKHAHILFGLFSWIIGLQQPYYAFYAAIGIAFALLYSVCRKQFAKALESAAYLSLIAVTTLAGNIGALLHTSDVAMEYMRQQRTVGSIEFYGLKLINLLLPIQNHRLPFLAKLRQHYDVLVSAGGNEAAWVSLGFILSVCLCVALTASLIHSGKEHCIKICGSFILAFILVSTVGGGSSVIGLIFPLLRCYNRMVIFIAMFCVIVFAILANRLRILLTEKKVPHTIQCGILLLLAAFAIWDQTSTENIYAYEAAKEEYLRDEEFVQAIEAIMPAGACIFELPTLPAGTTSIQNLKDYELYKPYLHAKTTRWLHMYSVGSRTDQWVNLLHGLPLRTAIDVIVCCDFQGIYMDSRGYTPDVWEETLTVMNSLENTAVIQSADGQKVFYDLTGYAAYLEERIGSDKMRQYADFWLDCPNINCFSAAGPSLAYTKEAAPRDDGRIIVPGCMQYGPYIAVTPGDYIVYIVGENLKDMDFDVSYANGTTQLPVHVLQRENDTVKYTFHVDTETYGIEMRCANMTDQDAVLRSIFLFNREQSYEISMAEALLELHK